jgi:hypothetical protein
MTRQLADAVAVACLAAVAAAAETFTGVFWWLCWPELAQANAGHGPGRLATDGMLAGAVPCPAFAAFSRASKPARVPGLSDPLRHVLWPARAAGQASISVSGSDWT